MCELARSRLSCTSVDWFIYSPLGLVADRYVQHLIERGYTAGTASIYLESATHLAHWMVLRRVELARLDEDVVHRFLERHLPVCRCAMVPARATPGSGGLGTFT